MTRLSLYEQRLYAFGLRVHRYVASLRRSHPIGYVACQLPSYPVWHKDWPNRIEAHETEGWVEA